ncbi:MAG: VOC family protein [Candidatus Binatus sp.]|uniref:VOC family protein n=1 Tax=Candidatus Binatus sp. TaxID=2811406 RepID=UPI00272809E7|nr:VOC family protein [Candidatus Binatus sp.]MDO8431641.1 VOC family protein [Candidatus Binatus sp.]
MDCPYDRASEDLGNIVALEHVNVTVPDQQLATLFYVIGLGLTRDPYLMNSITNMWVNIGRNQFHLPTNKPQVVRGHVGIVVPDRAALLTRLTRLRKRLDGTSYGFFEHEEFVEAVCPWGNRIRCYEPSEHFKPISLGIAYVEFDVPIGAAEGISHFYRRVMAAPSDVVQAAAGAYARVTVGIGQRFIFRETDREIPPYDGHHVQVYVADFSGPHRQLQEKELVFEESDQHQYRFRDIVEPESGALLFKIEHEVRSMKHPLYMRPLVNRNPAQSNMNYMPGHDAWV